MSDSIQFTYQVIKEIKSEKKILLLLIFLYFLLSFTVDFNNTINIYTSRGFTTDIAISNFLDLSFIFLNLQTYALRLVTIILIIIMVNIINIAFLVNGPIDGHNEIDLKSILNKIQNVTLMMLFSIIFTLPVQKLSEKYYFFNIISISLSLIFVFSLFLYFVLHFSLVKFFVEKIRIPEKITYILGQFISLSPILIGYLLINKYTSLEFIKYLQDTIGFIFESSLINNFEYITKYHENKNNVLMSIFLFALSFGSYLAFVGSTLYKRLDPTLLMGLWISIVCVIPFSNENTLKEKIFNLNMIQCSIVYMHANLPISGLLSSRDKETVAVVRKKFLVESTEKGVLAQVQRHTVFIRINDIKLQTSTPCLDALN